MELRSTRELRRNARLESTPAKKADTPAKTQAKPAPDQPADKLSLSRQAVAYVEGQSRRMWAQDQEREPRPRGPLDAIMEAMESKKKELDSMEKRLDVLRKCQKIAASIMKGNRVPPEDLQYLMNNDPEGYKLAMAMRRPNPDPEDEKSVLDDEDKNGVRAEGTEGGGEGPSVEAAGGGEISAAAES